MAKKKMSKEEELREQIWKWVNDYVGDIDTFDVDNANDYEVTVRIRKLNGKEKIVKIDRDDLNTYEV